MIQANSTVDIQNHLNRIDFLLDNKFTKYLPVPGIDPQSPPDVSCTHSGTNLNAHRRNFNTAWKVVHVVTGVWLIRKIINNQRQRVIVQQIALSEFKANGRKKLDKYSAILARPQEIPLLEKALSSKIEKQEEIAKSYQHILRLKRKITIYKWIEQNAKEGEITESQKIELIQLLKDDNKKQFAIALDKIIKGYISSMEGNKGACYFFWKELQEGRKKKNAKDPFEDLATLLEPVRFYSKMCKPLAQLSTEMVSVYSQLKLYENSLDNTGLNETLAKVNGKIKRLEDACKHILNNKISSEFHLRYHMGAKMGNIRKHFREIHDTQEAIAKMRKGVQEDLSHRKSVLIATCSYGGGHKTAAEAVVKYLEGHAHVNKVDFSTDLLPDLQFSHKLGKFLGKKHWNDAYIFNKLAQKQCIKFLNFYTKMEKFFRKIFHVEGDAGVSPPSPDKDTKTKTLLRENFLNNMPDQIVTVYHMNLYPILEVAEELGIPVAHLATDFDIKARCVFGNEPPKYKHFKVMATFEKEKIRQSAIPLKPEQLTIGGAPVRPEFLTTMGPDEIAALKKERGLEPGTRVVLVMGGANGNIVPFPELLANSKTWKERTHVIVIAGGNEGFRKKLEKGNLKRSGRFLQGSNNLVTIEVARDSLPVNPHKPCFLRGSEIANLQEMADAVLTKPGGLSTMEALYKGTPLLFDHRFTLLAWEEDTVEQVVDSGRGIDNRDIRRFEADLSAALQIGKDRKHESFKKLATDQNLRNLIMEMQEKAAGDVSMKTKRAQYTAEVL